jgi:hypothetical protein
VEGILRCRQIGRQQPFVVDVLRLVLLSSVVVLGFLVKLKVEVDESAEDHSSLFG